MMNEQDMSLDGFMTAREDINEPSLTYKIATPPLADVARVFQAADCLAAAGGGGGGGGGGGASVVGPGASAGAQLNAASLLNSQSHNELATNPPCSPGPNCGPARTVLACGAGDVGGRLDGMAQGEHVLQLACQTAGAPIHHHNHHHQQQQQQHQRAQSTTTLWTSTESNNNNNNSNLFNQQRREQWREQSILRRSRPAGALFEQPVDVAMGADANYNHQLVAQPEPGANFSPPLAAPAEHSQQGQLVGSGAPLSRLDTTQSRADSCDGVVVVRRAIVANSDDSALDYGPQADPSSRGHVEAVGVDARTKRTTTTTTTASASSQLADGISQASFSAPLAASETKACVVITVTEHSQPPAAHLEPQSGHNHNHGPNTSGLEYTSASTKTSAESSDTTGAATAGAANSSTSDKLRLQPAIGNCLGGSLSDGYYNKPDSGYERRQMEDRLRNWKKSNKLITHIRENPFNLHLDCLERLADSGGSVEAPRAGASAANGAGQTPLQHEPAKPADSTCNPNLQSYASHLSNLYKRNQASMDKSADFRTLLYNIICCLLIQDDQVLATASVTKMIEVIRNHLDSASKFYSDAIQLLNCNSAVADSEAQQQVYGSQPTAAGVAGQTLACRANGNHSNNISNNNNNNNNNSADQSNNNPVNVNCKSRKSSLGSWSCTSSSSGGPANTQSSARSSQHNLAAPGHQAPLPAPTGSPLGPASESRRLEKPMDFRRVSSVSYNDEQLINDLCADVHQHRTASCATPSALQAPESPWRYEQLSTEWRQSGQSCTTSVYESNNNSNHSDTPAAAQSAASGSSQTQLDLMNDSGLGGSTTALVVVGSIVQLQSAALGPARTSSRPSSRQQRKRHSDVGEFRPKQQPSYVSTDDYLSQYRTEPDDSSYSTLGGYEGAGNSSSARSLRRLSGFNSEALQLGAGESSDVESQRRQQSVDVASRRAELEWTLNKLVNFEHKYAWLTSKDTLRRAIRKTGVPNEIRAKVWSILIDQMIGNKYHAASLLASADETIAGHERSEARLRKFEQQQQQQQGEGEGEDETQYQYNPAFQNTQNGAEPAADPETEAILKQINLDVNRTMPGHRLFDDGAEGGIKLRRVLVAYSIHVNRQIAYCQGFNFIVALLLSVFEGDEEKALRGFVCIVDHIFPSKFYFDNYLTGARADQFLLADFICDQLIKNPTSAERKMVEGVTSSITLNWFISLFHGAVPTLTRLTILDQFMLDGVKALFRFTMAILYLAFQSTPPASCEVFTSIRNTAKDMYDIKLLLSIVSQIKLPKDSYFAIRRSFYMVQSSFNSDQFYMQSLASDTSRQMAPNKPLSAQHLPDTKPPAMSLISGAPMAGSGHHHHAHQHHHSGHFGPRVCTSADRSKVCVQNIGKLGRSHIKIMDANVRSNERSLMSPLRNSLVIGISNCGRNIIIARQSSKRCFRIFREQDLTFHVHELCTEVFDGYYLEDTQLALIVTHPGEVFKIDVARCYVDSQVGAVETLSLRDSHTMSDQEKLKMRLASVDVLTNLLWIYIECEDVSSSASARRGSLDRQPINGRQQLNGFPANNNNNNNNNRFKSNNPFLYGEDDFDDSLLVAAGGGHQRKIIIIDLITFDIFSAFTLHQSFGEITSMRASLVAFCQLANPMSSQFSSRIVRIGPAGRYEHLLSFSDVVDFKITVIESAKHKNNLSQSKQNSADSKRGSTLPKYSSLKNLFYRSISMHVADDSAASNSQQPNRNHKNDNNGEEKIGSASLTRYYRSLVRSQTITMADPTAAATTTSSMMKQDNNNNNNNSQARQYSPLGLANNVIAESDESATEDTETTVDHPCRSILTSCLGDLENMMETNYVPVNMAFIFRNGKIALFEFTESYAIHTRESQLDRYDYAKVVEVTKNGQDFIVTILTIFDKLIKVVI